VALPKLNWTAGGDRESPTGYTKNVEKAKMLDGTVRANFKAKSQKSFTLEWDLLPAADVLTLRGLAELNEPLRFQNNWLDATWRWVFVSRLDVDAIQSTFAASARFRAVMTLEEIT